MFFHCFDAIIMNWKGLFPFSFAFHFFLVIWSFKGELYLGQQPLFNLQLYITVKPSSNYIFSFVSEMQ